MKRNFILTVCFLLSLCVNAQDKMGEFEKKVYVSEAGDTLRSFAIAGKLR